MVLPCVGVVKRLKMIKHHDLLTPAAEGNQGTHQRDVIFLFYFLSFNILFKLLLTLSSPCHWGIPLFRPPFSLEYIIKALFSTVSAAGIAQGQ